MPASAVLLITLLSANVAQSAAPSPTMPEIQRLLGVIATDPANYAHASDTLRQLAPAHLPELLTALGDSTKSSHFRGTLTSIVCRVKPLPPEVPPTIVAWAFDAERSLTERGDFIQALPHCMPTQDAGPLLQRALRAPERELRQAAVRGIQYLHEPFRPLFDDLLQLVQADPEPEMRCWSAEALETFGVEARRALSALRQAAARDPDSYVRECLGETIQIIERRQS